MSAERLRVAVYGCTVAAELAASEGDMADHRLMMARIEELTAELARRLT